MFLSKELELLHSHFSNLDKKDLSISSQGVSWHIDHSLKTIIKVCELLERSDPSEYKYKMNAARTYVFTRNSIPRGRGKSPKSVLPPDTITLDDIENQLQKVNTVIKELPNLHKNAHFKHPYFGALNLKMTTKFLKIHTQHHIKIIEDIINQSSGKK